MWQRLREQGRRLREAEVVGEFWHEFKRVKWAVLIALLPVVFLDLFGVRLDVTGRWAPLIGKTSVVTLGLIVAHLITTPLFYYVRMWTLWDRLIQRGDLASAVAFGLTFLARAILYGWLVNSFVLGL